MMIRNGLTLGFLLFQIHFAHAQIVAPLRECGDLNGDNEKRLAACTRAIEGGALDTSTLLMAHVNRGRWLLEKGDSNGAIADFTKAVDIDPSNPNYALYYRGQAYLKAGSKEQAIADFKKILETNPVEQATREALKKLGVEPPATPPPSNGSGGGGGGFIFY